MSKNEWLLMSYKTDKNNNLQPDDNSTPSLYKDKKGYSWIHLDANSPGSKEWLSNHTQIDPLWIEALLTQDTRPRISNISNEAIIVILRGINLNINAEPEDMISIRLYVDKSQVISCIFRNLKAIEELQHRIHHNKSPKSTADFLAKLIYLLNNEIDPIIRHLNMQIDLIEEQIIDTPNHNIRQTIVDLRKQSIIFKRYLIPQREVLHSLIHIDESWIQKADRYHISESHNKVLRYVEDLESIRERTQIVQDELNNHLADKLNHNTYKLSVAANIFLPLTFLTGLFGVNVGGIPGATNELAFIIFGLSLLVIIIIQI